MTSSRARIEIARLDDAPRVFLQVGADRAPEELVAELGAEHVQDEPALLVEVAIEDVDRRVVVLADDGPAVAAVGLAEVGIRDRRAARSSYSSLPEVVLGSMCSMKVAKPSFSQPCDQSRQVT